MSILFLNPQIFLPNSYFYTLETRAGFEPAVSVPITLNSLEDCRDYRAFFLT